MEYESVSEKLVLPRISVASTISLKMKNVIRLESTPLFMEQLQSYVKSKNYFHIIDSLKAQLGLCMKNTIELSSPIIIITDKKAHFVKKR